ncbi:MAG TPA: glycosyltransferase family 4 protein [Candidatus Dormibacteraeota bacterium]|nr:glycosyltransferase family 4 protein [Candidatus Dormibacteraeota bacterium]
MTQRAGTRSAPAQSQAGSPITFLIYSPFPKYSGGRENWLSHLSPRLHERARAVRVIAYATDRPPFHDLDRSGIDLVALPSVRYFYGAFSFLNRATLGALKYLDLFVLYPIMAAAYLRWKRPAVLVCMNPIPEGLAALLAGVPYVVSVRGDVPKGLASRPFSFLERPLRWLERLVLRRARKVLSNGRDTQGRLSSEGIASTVVPNGVDVARFAQAIPAGDLGRELVQRAAGRPIIAFIATMDEIHGVNDAIDCAVQLKAMEAGFLLAMVGKGDVSAFRERAMTLGLAGSIEFMGEAESVLDVLQLSSMFLGLSRGNGMSMSALEAMAAGVPIVARDALTYRQLIEDDVSGLLETGPAELAAGCLRLLREPETARRLATAAQAAVREYDWQKVADVFLAELA